jgi:hypothetical protein
MFDARTLMMTRTPSEIMVFNKPLLRGVDLQTAQDRDKATP